MKSKQVLLAVVCASCWLSQQEVQARWYAGRGAVAGYALGAGLGGWGGGYGYGGVGTAASAEGQAMADMVRSAGAYNAMTSGAMINVEQARGQYIENAKQWTDLYMMRNRARRELMAQAAEDKQVRDARIQAYKEAHPSRLPPRLVSMQFDPSTGKISWPAALNRDAFTEQRSALDALFLSRAHTGTTSELSSEISGKVREMQNELRKHIRDLPTAEYIEARKFLDSLALEGQTPLS